MSEERKPVVHELKVWQTYYPAVEDGTKPFELRKNDRDYRVGDSLWLREYVPEVKIYTGRQCEREVTYILGLDAFFGNEPQGDGYVVLGLATSRPPNRPLLLPELFDLEDDDAAWVVAENGKIYAMGAECAQEWASEEHCLFFARKPTPEDIEEARKEDDHE